MPVAQPLSSRLAPPGSPWTLQIERARLIFVVYKLPRLSPTAGEPQDTELLFQNTRMLAGQHVGLTPFNIPSRNELSPAQFDPLPATPRTSGE